MCPMLMTIAHFNGLSLCVHYMRPSYESIKEKSLLLFDFIQQQLRDNGIFLVPMGYFPLRPKLEEAYLHPLPRNTYIIKLQSVCNRASLCNHLL